MMTTRQLNEALMLHVLPFDRSVNSLVLIANHFACVENFLLYHTTPSDEFLLGYFPNETKHFVVANRVVVHKAKSQALYEPYEPTSPNLEIEEDEENNEQNTAQTSTKQVVMGYDGRVWL